MGKAAPMKSVIMEKTEESQCFLSFHFDLFGETRHIL